jgi:type I restriction enzyme S subunit
VSVPSHWTIHRLKEVAIVRPSNVDKKSVEGERAVRLCNYVDVYKNDRITADMEFMEATATDAQIKQFSLRGGDVIITKDSETWDDIAVPAYVPETIDSLVCGYHLALIRPDARRLDGAYLARCFAAEGLCDQFRVAANGITRYGLDTQSIKCAVFPVPPLPEQRTIAAFLDRETTRIDALIGHKERLIALLEEKRQTVISHAVTHGLNPSRRMQEASLPGLGQIPMDWRPIALKRAISYITSGSRGWAEYYSDDGDWFIQSGNLNQRLGLDLATVQRVKPPEGAELVRTQIRREDVLVCVTGAYTGNVAVVDVDLPRAFVNQHVALLRPIQSVVQPKFLAAVLASSIGQWQFQLSQYGGTKQGLGLGDIRSVELNLPPLQEQTQIVDHLDHTTSRLDQLSFQIREGIDRLLEYRTALISAAVTGQIDVRDEVTS